MHVSANIIGGNPREKVWVQNSVPHGASTVCEESVLIFLMKKWLMGDFINPSNTASKSPHNDGGQKVCSVFKLLSFYEMISDRTLSGVQCTKYNGRSMVRIC
jgi:hypothetical protein